MVSRTRICVTLYVHCQSCSVCTKPVRSLRLCQITIQSLSWTLPGVKQSEREADNISQADDDDDDDDNNNNNP